MVHEGEKFNAGPTLPVLVIGTVRPILGRVAPQEME